MRIIRRHVIGVLLLGVIVAIVSLALIGYINHLLHVRESTTKVNLHTIQLAIESFSNRYDSFPSSLDTQLLTTTLGEHRGYEFPPRNAFTNKPMRNIDFSSTRTAGDFTYILMPPGNYNGKHVGYDSYYLIAYCSPSNPGLDIDEDGVPDHVCIILKSEREVMWDWNYIRAHGGKLDPVEADKAYRSPPVPLSEALKMLHNGTLADTH
jgi:hypothetical protein